MFEVFRKEAAMLLEEVWKELEIPIESALLEEPMHKQHGDLAYPCFQLAKTLGKSPAQIAQEISAAATAKITAKIGTSSEKNVWGGSVAQVVALGPYVNISASVQRCIQDVVEEIFTKKDTYGAGSPKKEIILVESPSPNTNKPLHLGHVRNMLLGNALCSLLLHAWYKAIRTEVVNDRGVHICKSMLAYQKFGAGQQPTKKSDHFVGDYYVRYDQYAQEHPDAEQEIQEMLKKWEDGDLEIRALREQMNARAIAGFATTYKRYGVTMDKQYFESEHYEHGKDVVYKRYEKGLFTKDEKWNIVCDLEDVWLGTKVMLRADGTSIYVTQDIALAQLRYEEYKMDRMVYVVANEQEYHFQVLFEVFNRLWFSFAPKCYHMSYGMISLPDGKMKSRTWNVVDADNLADDMHESAWEVLRERYADMEEKELRHRAEAIAMAAIKFFILKYEASKNFVFDKQTSLSFEWETWPYVQYTYARCMSMLKKSWVQGGGDPNFKNISSAGSAVGVVVDTENTITAEDIGAWWREILVVLSKFPDVIQQAAERYQPYLVVRYLLDIAHLFNAYYQQVMILQAEQEHQKTLRLRLVSAVAHVLHQGLTLLGVETLDQM